MKVIWIKEGNSKLNQKNLYKIVVILMMKILMNDIDYLYTFLYSYKITFYINLYIIFFQ